MGRRWSEATAELCRGFGKALLNVKIESGFNISALADVLRVFCGRWAIGFVGVALPRHGA